MVKILCVRKWMIYPLLLCIFATAFVDKSSIFASQNLREVYETLCMTLSHLTQPAPYAAKLAKNHWLIRAFSFVHLGEAHSDALTISAPC